MQRYKRMLFATIFILVAIHGWSLMRYPTPFIDEVWLASRSWTLIETGRAFGPLDQGVFDRLDGYWTFFPWLRTWVQSLALRLFAAPNLFSIRIISLVFGAVMLTSVYSISRQLSGKWAALTTLIFTGLSYGFLYSAHLGRADIITSAFGFLSIALMVRDGPYWKFLLGGFTLGLSLLMHLNGLIYIPVIGILFLIHWGWRTFIHPKAWLFLFGLSSMGLVYYFQQIAPYPQTYQALNNLIFGPSHVPPLLTFDLSLIAINILILLITLLASHSFLLPLFFASKKPAAVEQTAHLKQLAILILVPLFFALIVRNKLPYYVILYSPAIDMWLAKNTVNLLYPNQSTAKPRRTMLISTLLLAAFSLNLYPIAHHGFQEYSRVEERVRQHIALDDSIMASQTFWFGFTEHEYIGWQNLVYYQRYDRTATLEDTFLEFAPDILILETTINTYTYDIEGDQTDSDYEYLHIPKTELFAVIAKYGTLLDAFTSVDYGEVAVYRMRWPKDN